MGPRKQKEPSNFDSKQNAMRITVAQSYKGALQIVSCKPRVLLNWNSDGLFISSNPSVIKGCPLRDINSQALLVLRQKKTTKTKEKERKVLKTQGSSLTRTWGLLVGSRSTPEIVCTQLVNSKRSKGIERQFVLSAKSCKDHSMVSGNPKSSVNLPLLYALYK